MSTERTVYSSLPPFQEMMGLLGEMVADAAKSYQPDLTVDKYTYSCMEKEYSEEDMEAINTFIKENNFVVAPSRFSLFHTFAPVHHPHPSDWEQPRRATELSAGYDLRIPCDIVVPAENQFWYSLV